MPVGYGFHSVRQQSQECSVRSAHSVVPFGVLRGMCGEIEESHVVNLADAVQPQREFYFSGPGQIVPSHLSSRLKMESGVWFLLGNFQRSF